MAAADGVFRCLLEGSISSFDNGIERRPYHRNCGCALHNGNISTAKVPICTCGNVSYPIRRSWSEGSLVIAASCSAHSSPSSSPAAGRPPLGFGRSVTREKS
ncbi:hypothetical protein QN277_007075 [Acacia crassicarpa]|uniref:Uncharacterized protein n=1 Tax=Acacia crassicarpa TaxID=499986 RepID=A0AAE1M8G6_9FABA|nr:hypothetical protein QN277_007075 [Acacia crassicarpa]